MAAAFKISGYTILVGAGGGIGIELGASFAEAGSKGVIIGDINYEAAVKSAEHSKTVATAKDYKAIPVKVNVTDAKSVQDMVDVAIKEFGRIDYVVNAAGVDGRKNVPFDQADVSDFDRVFDINAKSILYVTQAVAKVMKAQEPAKVDLGRHGVRDVGRGSIVNISSILGISALPNKVAYITSKHAVGGLTRACAVDYKAVGIRCNQVCPSWVDTPMSWEEYNRIPQLRGLIEQLPAAGRLIAPWEVASACLYLCTPAAYYINGSTLTLDSCVLVGPAVPAVE
ncbi:NAD(P)-binding protein [Daldinia caldariorum]|uniref:NAD(P)-binding protein n=1 Tax=Daldinia caldariorum TaxID=326644 RepID=UPI002007AC47|nr:NAD(P)-binding protein [Daldinia caldariorum]KAI1466551.1 NAD(P)-binding protein [Daldinia caldariorum]